ncbi:hypothetical protein [Herminiimonas sp. KBW02]|uniref:hypothetical protein n=1 Tax=Herminiimonas sp. KBW02 TaxID=2153363 RepID=UPI000F59BFD9|nr:hypothetical protein [Herminiimonas sp. KBW02]
MAKSHVLRTSTSKFVVKSTASAELATLRTVVFELKKKPQELRKIAVKAGVSTPTGRVPSIYRSK